jgi:hypothetical protein
MVSGLFLAEMAMPSECAIRSQIEHSAYPTLQRGVRMRLLAYEVNSWGLGIAINRPRACLVGLRRVWARRSSLRTSSFHAVPGGSAVRASDRWDTSSRESGVAKTTTWPSWSRVRKLAVIAWRFLTTGEPHRDTQRKSTETKLAGLRVAATGEKRRGGSTKGVKSEAVLPGHGRSVRSLDQVLQDAGSTTRSPPRRRVSPRLANPGVSERRSHVAEVRHLKTLEHWSSLVAEALGGRSYCRADHAGGTKSHSMRIQINET